MEKTRCCTKNWIVLGISVGIKGKRGTNHCELGEGCGAGIGIMITPLTERTGGWFGVDGGIVTVLHRETLNATHLHVLKIRYPHLREV